MNVGDQGGRAEVRYADRGIEIRVRYLYGAAALTGADVAVDKRLCAEPVLDQTTDGQQREMVRVSLGFGTEQSVNVAPVLVIVAGAVGFQHGVIALMRVGVRTELTREAVLLGALQGLIIPADVEARPVGITPFVMLCMFPRQGEAANRDAADLLPACFRQPKLPRQRQSLLIHRRPFLLRDAARNGQMNKNPHVASLLSVMVYIVSIVREGARVIEL